MDVKPPRVVVFSDLDGTLLEHGTYSTGPAEQAIARLVAQDVPLVLCSSKTRREIEAIRTQLGIRHPFIAENGAATFIPAGYFASAPKTGRVEAGYEIIEIGLPYASVVSRLCDVAARLGIGIVGFHQLTTDHIARETGLPIESSRLAKAREYDEAFRLAVEDPTSRNRLCDALEAEGLRCVQGGRFLHVTGGADKGMAVTVLARLYRRAIGDLVTVALGDGMNDRPMLASVDVPIIVRNPAADPDGELVRALPAAWVTEREGPAGWAAAVLAVLDDPAKLLAPGTGRVV